MINRRLTLTFALALTTVLSMNAQDDDLYFVPQTKKANSGVYTASSNRSGDITTINAQPPVLAVYGNSTRSEDEYNRRYRTDDGSWQISGGEGDSLAYVENPDSIYDINNPELDYLYSRRILRFHSPRLGFYVASPYYWDLVYGYGAFDYYYTSYYDPFYWNYGWGYGYASGPWDYWYGPIWGWSHPAHWGTWGHGPGWSHSHHANNVPVHSHRFMNDAHRPARTGEVGGVRTNSLLYANSNRTRYNNMLRTSQGPSASVGDNNQNRSRSMNSYDRPSSTRQSVYNNRPVRTGTNVNNNAPVRTESNVSSNTPVRTESNVNSNTPARTGSNLNNNRTVRTESRTNTAPTRTESNSSRSNSTSSPSRSVGGSSTRSSGFSGGSMGGGSFGGGSRGGSIGGGRVGRH